MKRSLDKLHMFMPGAKFTTWLGGFAKNVLSEYYRKKNKENKILDIDSMGSNEIDIDSYGYNPIEIIIDRERKDCIEGSIGELNKEHQEIIKLRLYNKASMKQISTLTGETVDALDSRFRRAKKSLKEKINENRC